MFTMYILSCLSFLLVQNPDMFFLQCIYPNTKGFRKDNNITSICEFGHKMACFLNLNMHFDNQPVTHFVRK